MKCKEIIRSRQHGLSVCLKQLTNVETAMVIYKITPSLTTKSGDGVGSTEGHIQGRNKNIYPQGRKCHRGVKPVIIPRKIPEEMETVSPGIKRRSFKYIERNVVQKRTTVFETVPTGLSSFIVNDDDGVFVTHKQRMSSAQKMDATDKHDKENVSDSAGLTVAERAKLFTNSDSNVNDSKGAVPKKPPSEGAQSAKPPVSPKKPCVAKKPVPNSDEKVSESETTTPKRPPKPDRPPAPHLKIVQEVSSPSNEAKNKSSNDVSNSEHQDTTPRYAKVNKKTQSTRESEAAESNSDRTKKVYLENITLKPVEKKLAESVLSTAKIQPTNVGSSTKPAAPPKPPRTFAHDEYLAVKAAKKKDKDGKTLSCVASFELGDARPGGHIYEEIKEVESISETEEGVRPSDMKTSSPEPVIYEKVKDVDDDRVSVKREIRTNDSGYSYATVEEDGDKRKFVVTRPAPPPPRPPQPSVRTKGTGRKDDSPLVRVNKHASHMDERDIIRKKNITNPGYEQQPETIPIKTFRSPNGEMKRYKSDECLYAELKEESPDRKHVSFSDDSPIYQDPVDVVRPHRSNSTHVPPGTVPATDAEGYAIPDTRRHTYHRQFSEGPWHPPNHKFSTLQHPRNALNDTPSRFSRNWAAQVSIRRKTAREKVSRAYSVLRKRPVPDEAAERVPKPETVEDDYVPYEPAGGSNAPDFGAGCFGILSSDDQDSEVDMEEHKRRLKHVNSLKEKTYNAVNWTMSMKRCRFAKLFHYSLVVGLKKVEDQNTYKPYIIASFPLKEQEQVENILNFCFPDAENWRPVTHYTSESFCFVLTHEDGSRQYGYCRRLLPPGDANRLPEVYCVVSPIGAFNMYEQLMQKIETLRKQSAEYPQCLLKAAFSRTFPDPGQEAWINLRLDDRRQTVILKRSLDEKLESVSFGPLLSHLGIDIMLKVYASILLERRIIFTAQHLGTLSSCIQGIVSLLYPFSWQHIYIPVLPAAILEICCSPTPFIIGILSTSVPKLQDLPLDEVLIVDLDNNNLLRTIGDEAKIIPRKIQRALATALKDDSDIQSTKDTIVFEAFLRLFIETMGHYADCISTQQDGKSVFQKDIFCRAVSSRSIRMFLEWFVETQMFEVFVTTRTEQGIPEDGYFERRVTEYRDEMAAESTKFKDNVKQFGKKMISFVRESGGKIKKAFGGSSHVYV